MQWTVDGWTRKYACRMCKHGTDITHQCLSCTVWYYHYNILDRMPQLTPFGWNSPGKKKTTEKKYVQLKLEF